MNRLLVCLFLMSATRAQAEHHYWRNARRAMTAAYCAASAVDGWQSANYVNGTTVRESNALLRTPTGVNVPLMIGLKAATCGTVFVVGELTDRTPFQKAITGAVGSFAVAQIRTDFANSRQIH